MILNLDRTFEPFGKGIDFKDFMFPSGCEAHIKLIENSDIWDETMLITTRIKSSDDIMKLLLATDAIKTFK